MQIKKQTFDDFIHIFNRKKISKAVLVLVYTSMHNFLKKKPFKCISAITIVYFRSPWSNTYDPPLDDGTLPSDRLRKLEIDANTAFDQYREMLVLLWFIKEKRRY